MAQVFESAINGHNHGDSIVQSNGAVHNVDEWDFGFNLDASPVAQHGVLSNSHNKNGQNDLDNGLNPSPIVRDANGGGHVWDFKDAFSDASDFKLVSWYKKFYILIFNKFDHAILFSFYFHCRKGRSLSSFLLMV